MANSKTKFLRQNEAEWHIRFLPAEDSDSDEDFEEVQSKDGYEDDVPEHLKIMELAKSKSSAVSATSHVNTATSHVYSASSRLHNGNGRVNTIKKSCFKLLICYYPFNFVLLL